MAPLFTTDSLSREIDRRARREMAAAREKQAIGESEPAEGLAEAPRIIGSIGHYHA